MASMGPTFHDLVRVNLNFLKMQGWMKVPGKKSESGDLEWNNSIAKTMKAACTCISVIFYDGISYNNRKERIFNST